MIRERTLNQLLNLSITKNIDIKVFEATLYPNPARNFTNLNLHLENAGEINVNVINASGKLVQKFQFPGSKGLNKKIIDLSKFASGSYSIKIDTKTQVQTLSLLKQ